MRRLWRGAAVLLAVGFACAAYTYLTLPDVRSLRTRNPETTAFIELRAREARRNGRDVRRVQRWIPYSRISPHLTRAVLVAEDSRFWRHHGVDFDEVKESVEVNIARGEFARGASTITQQLAKNLYLSPSRNPVRKVREVFIARQLEAELSKTRILELYLNVIEWGDGIYGAEAAAQSYFRKPAVVLEPHEAALLAAAIRNPRALSPARPSPKLRALQQLIMRRMGAVSPSPISAEAGSGPRRTVSPAQEGTERGAARPAAPPSDPPGEHLPAPRVPAPTPCAVPPCG